MSRIGLYRYKLDNLNAAEVTRQVTFYVNSVAIVTHVVNIDRFCTDEKLLKYLDKSGQYRFISFNKYWEGRNNVENLGFSNHIVNSILDAQSNQRNLGYKNKKTLTLTKNNVTSTQLEEIQQILTSPRVYLLIGQTDSEQDWLLVNVRVTDNIYRHKKRTTTDFTLEIELPEDFSQKMI
jgi:hypothetical protein